MNQSKLYKNIVFVFSALLFISFVSTAQAQKAKKPRLSLKAGVYQRIGVDTDINISYSRPGVKGRKIWGGLVPYGLAPGNNESKGKPFPWRGGANECTTIDFSKNVTIDGHKLPAGKYSMDFIPEPKVWISPCNQETALFPYPIKWI